MSHITALPLNFFVPLRFMCGIRGQPKCSGLHCGLLPQKERLCCIFWLPWICSTSFPSPDKVSAFHSTQMGHRMTSFSSYNDSFHPFHSSAQVQEPKCRIRKGSKEFLVFKNLNQNTRSIYRQLSTCWCVGGPESFQEKKLTAARLKVVRSPTPSAGERGN